MRLGYLLVVLILLSGCQSDTPKPVNPGVVPWTRLGPGGGGSTFIPTFSYQDANTFLVRCDMTGAYLSGNGGQSYSQINFPGGASAFAFDPADSLVLYAGSKSLNRSVDGGRTWTRIFPGNEDIRNEYFRGDHADFGYSIVGENYHDQVGTQPIRNILVDPNNSDAVYFSLGNMFFATDDYGNHWTSVGFDKNIEYIYTNSSDVAKSVLVFTGSGLYSLNKSGWEQSFLPFPDSMKSAFSFTGGTDKMSRTLLYGLSNDISLREHGGQTPTAVWVSRDIGHSWKKLEHETLTNSQYIVPTYSRVNASEYNAEVAYLVASSYQEPLGDGNVAHWYGTLKTEDRGKSWKWVWKGGGGSGQYAVKDGQDAGNLEDAWVRGAFGGEYVRLIDVGVAPQDGDIAIVTDWYRTMKTDDGGSSWHEIYSEKQPDGTFSSRGLDVTTAYGVHFDPHDPDHIAISYTDIGYHHSFNRGQSWIRSTDGIPPPWHNTCYWMVFDPDIKDKIWSVWSGLHDFPRGKMTRNPKWTEYGRGGVAISTDGGRSWKPLVDGMGFNSPSTSIVLDPNSPASARTLFVATYGKGVFKSIDGGHSWKLHNHGIEGSLAAFELTILPDGTLYLITSPTPKYVNGNVGREVWMGAVYKSEDGAETWTKLDLGDKVLFPNGLAFDQASPKKLYLGAWGDIQLSDLIGGAVARETGGNQWYDLDGGVHFSDDGGLTWTQIFDPDHYVYDVTVDPEHPGRLYCNTFDRGAYRSDDHGKTWRKMQGYDFHWGHRVIPDPIQRDKVYLTTFGSSIWYGTPVLNNTYE